MCHSRRRFIFALAFYVYAWKLNTQKGEMAVKKYNFDREILAHFCWVKYHFLCRLEVNAKVLFHSLKKFHLNDENNCSNNQPKIFTYSFHSHNITCMFVAFYTISNEPTTRSIWIDIIIHALTILKPYHLSEPRVSL